MLAPLCLVMLGPLISLDNVIKRSYPPNFRKLILLAQLYCSKKLQKEPLITVLPEFLISFWLLTIDKQENGGQMLKLNN